MKNKNSNKESSQSKNLSLFDLIILTIFILVIMSITYISYFMEERGYNSIFGDKNYNIIRGINISIIIALTFNVAKIMLTYASASMAFYKKSKLGVYTLRSVLIIVSLLMTLFIVTNQFTSPFAQEVLDKNVERIDDKYYQKNLNLENTYLASKQNLKANFDEQIKTANDHYAPLIATHVEGQKLEMNNIDPRTGEWRGSRFGWHEEMREKYESELKDATDAITIKYNEDTAGLLEIFNQDQSTLLDAQTKEMSQETLDKYSNSYESQNRYLYNTVELLNKMGLPVKAFHMTFLISFILMIAIEMTPIILAGFLVTRALEHNN